MNGPASGLAPWRRRYLAPQVGFPAWARDRPDRLVHGSNESGRWEVYAWDRATGARQRLTDRPEGTSSGLIDPSGEWVWWFDDERGNEFGRWRRGRFEGGGAEPALPGLAASYPAGIALGGGVTVAGASGADGSAIHVFSASGPREIYRHREYASVASLSRDERLFAFTHSERGDVQHPAVRIADLSGAVMGEVDDGPGLGVRAGEWSPVAGDQRLIVSHEREGVRRPAVWSAGDGSLVLPALDLPGDVDATWFPDGGALLLEHDHRGRTDLHRLDLATGRLERVPHPAGTIAGAAVRPDGEVWFHWSDSASPPEVRAPSGAVLAPPGDPAPRGARYTDLWAGAVHALLAEPAGPRPHPVLFWVHGGPTAHVSDAFSPGVQSFVDHGLAVVMVNYRGSTGYGREWRDALIGRPGFTELEDIAAVQDLVLREGIAEPGRQVLYGRSWGGYLTLLGLGTQPERWALGVAGVPVADYPAAFEDEMEPLKAYDRSLFGGSPAELPDLYVRSSPLTYAENVRVPVLVMAGEHDPRCPIRQIDNYLARLRALGKPHEVHRYEAGHASLQTDEVVRQQELVLDFCARHLGTARPA